MFTADEVLAMHDLILSEEPGLHGDHGSAALEGALSRIDSRILYEGLDDVFEIAAMYAVALARGHVFNDANKRTALVTALAYLDSQGFVIERSDALEDLMVDVAEGAVESAELAALLFALAPGEP